MTLIERPSPGDSTAKWETYADWLEADLERERAARRVVDKALRDALLHREVRLLGELWIRSSDETTRRLGSDLLGVLGVM